MARCSTCGICSGLVTSSIKWLHSMNSSWGRFPGSSSRPISEEGIWAAISSTSTWLRDVEQAGDQMQVARPATASAHRQFTGGRRFGTGGEYGDFLVANVHPLDAVHGAQRIR